MEVPKQMIILDIYSLTFENGHSQSGLIIFGGGEIQRLADGDLTSTLDNRSHDSSHSFYPQCRRGDIMKLGVLSCLST